MTFPDLKLPARSSVQHRVNLPNVARAKHGEEATSRYLMQEAQHIKRQMLMHGDPRDHTRWLKFYGRRKEQVCTVLGARHWVCGIVGTTGAVMRMDFIIQSAWFAIVLHVSKVCVI